MSKPIALTDYAYPCGFQEIVDELEKMAGCQVRVSLERYPDDEVIGFVGRLFLAEVLCAGTAGEPQGRQLRYAVDEEKQFVLTEADFVSGHAAPGHVQIKFSDSELLVYRHHLPFDLREGPSGEDAAAA